MPRYSINDVFSLASLQASRLQLMLARPSLFQSWSVMQVGWDKSAELF
jgi:hypothetical protein